MPSPPIDALTRAAPSPLPPRVVLAEDDPRLRAVLAEALRAEGFDVHEVEAGDDLLAGVQEAYARAWQRWRRLRDYEDPEGWLRLVVTRLATDWWRATSGSGRRRACSP